MAKEEKTKMSKEIEYDELTMKIPKPVKDFLEAAHRFSKVKFSFEEWCYEQLIFGVKDSLEGDSIDSLFPDLAGPQLIEAYGLDKVFNFKEDEKN